VRAPESKQQPEHEQDAGAVAVQEAECFDQSRTQAGDLLAEVVDGEAKSLFELDARLPPQVVMRPPVVQRDPIHVALARWPERGSSLYSVRIASLRNKSLTVTGTPVLM